MSVTKELRGDAFAMHVEETVGDKNFQIIYRGMVIDGEKTLEEHGITHRVLVRLVSQNLTGVECPSESGSDDAGTAVSSSAAEEAPAATKRTLTRYMSDPVCEDARQDEVQRERQETWQETWRPPLRATASSAETPPFVLAPTLLVRININLPEPCGVPVAHCPKYSAFLV